MPVAGTLGRSATGGRNWEGFSPDPYLTGVGMDLTIRGVQSTGVQTTSKHYIGNEQETQRNPSTIFPDNTTASNIAGPPPGVGGITIEAVSSNIDDRTMHEVYLWPFADSVHAGTTSIMCSYNRINASYGCENSKILNGILKDELAFQGYVMSDWGATHSGVSSVLAGLDMVSKVLLIKPESSSQSTAFISLACGIPGFAYFDGADLLSRLCLEGLASLAMCLLIGEQILLALSKTDPLQKLDLTTWSAE